MYIASISFFEYNFTYLIKFLSIRHFWHYFINSKEKGELLMEYTFQFLWIFIIYSFLGWVFETTITCIQKKRFSNHGIINGPFCIIYGFAAVLMTLFTHDLDGSWLFLFCTIIATVVEYVSGHLIEKFYHARWWNYDRYKWNLDGYVCLPASLLWGALGFIAMKWGNGWLLHIYKLLPELLVKIFILLLIGLIIVDGLASFMILSHKSKNPKKWESTDALLDSFTKKLAKKIYRFVGKRIELAYQIIELKPETETHPEIFAYGCSFYKIVLLFFIGSFLGDITETIYCRLYSGVWMSRSSLVWGPFSIVWGLGIAAFTLLLYRYRNFSESFLFGAGLFLGGTYEYICSVLSEFFFGAVFWDYSHMPFNLGGRINLLYCIFWGIAAVVWFKLLYPFISKWIEKIPKKIGVWGTWIIIVFMVVNMFMSFCALIRYDERLRAEEPKNAFEQWIDKTFDDERIERTYPNILHVE